MCELADNDQTAQLLTDGHIAHCDGSVGSFRVPSGHMPESGQYTLEIESSKTQNMNSTHVEAIDPREESVASDGGALNHNEKMFAERLATLEVNIAAHVSRFQVVEDLMETLALTTKKATDTATLEVRADMQRLREWCERLDNQQASTVAYHKSLYDASEELAATSRVQSQQILKVTEGLNMLGLELTHRISEVESAADKQRQKLEVVCDEQQAGFKKMSEHGESIQIHENQLTEQGSAVQVHGETLTEQSEKLLAAMDATIQQVEQSKAETVALVSDQLDYLADNAAQKVLDRLRAAGHTTPTSPPSAQASPAEVRERGSLGTSPHHTEDSVSSPAPADSPPKAGRRVSPPRNRPPRSQSASPPNDARTGTAANKRSPRKWADSLRSSPSAANSTDNETANNKSTSRRPTPQKRRDPFSTPTSGAPPPSTKSELTSKGGELQKGQGTHLTDAGSESGQRGASAISEAGGSSLLVAEALVDEQVQGAIGRSIETTSAQARITSTSYGFGEAPDTHKAPACDVPPMPSAHSATSAQSTMTVKGIEATPRIGGAMLVPAGVSTPVQQQVVAAPKRQSMGTSPPAMPRSGSAALLGPHAPQASDPQRAQLHLATRPSAEVLINGTSSVPVPHIQEPRQARPDLTQWSPVISPTPPRRIVSGPSPQTMPQVAAAQTPGTPYTPPPALHWSQQPYRQTS
mmetsp:Transcript_65821/g.116880  ORF Transcript_65821/g.116880 Transcript_65821/m.116880 type:complete len:694 (-) Transcript_65821:225-2306(-)